MNVNNKIGTHDRIRTYICHPVTFLDVRSAGGYVGILIRVILLFNQNESFYLLRN